jgi:DNA replication and repair protein RecF
MISLQNITVTQFRNYLYNSFTFNERIIGIHGNNGTGKTNLLDAIHYLCFTKSYFSKPDTQSTFQNLKGFRIDGSFNKHQEIKKVICILRENNRKELQINDEVYKKFSSHIGQYPVVFVAPDDIQLITEGSEARRNFIDTILSQLFPDYLQYLIAYRKILDQRNSLLKTAAERNYLDETLISILDDQLIASGNEIFTYRKTFMASFIPLIIKEYQHITNDDDAISIEYISPLQQKPFAEILSENKQKDLYLQRTSSGIHKDDIEIQMQQLPFKTMASQGQRKSLLFAMKLAEYSYLKSKKGFAPLLLLDDVFEKLDAQRMFNLMHRVCVTENGQVFITDTHQERLSDTFKSLNIPYQLIGL